MTKRPIPGKGKKPARTVLAALGLAAAALSWGNTALQRSLYTVSCADSPEAFDGFRIAQVSDLHNCRLGGQNGALLAQLRTEKPDLIAITGDLVDSRHTDLNAALEFARGAAEIAPCYYVSGNHEARISNFAALKEGLLEAGVTVLEDEKISLERSGSEITLLGVKDPSFHPGQSDRCAMDAALKRMAPDQLSFTILLSHRPELFEIYVQHGVDLVLCGHAHGGQVRVPFVGGLAAPNQGIFPRYDAGLFSKNGTNMIVSRGIGNSIAPLRVLNRPEVVYIQLRSMDSGGN